MIPSLSIRLAVVALAALASGARAQAPDTTPTLEITGFVQADFGYNFRQSDPAWFDVNRPTKLPAFRNEFGRDGSFFAGVRTTHLAINGFFPAGTDTLKTVFDFDLFGTGDDDGQTTIHALTIYGEFGHFGAGQADSPFMDIDVFPNAIEYWGPNGMPFFRNVQVRWMPIQGDTRLTVALEQPGASGDAGNYADRVEIQNVSARFPLPDLSAEYRLARSWGYVETAGILRRFELDDLLDDAIDLSATITGWGLTLSSNINVGEANVVKLQGTYGEGIQNYMDDAPEDVGPRITSGDPRRPIVAEALPVFGMVAFLDHTWNERFTSAIGYSLVDVDNSTGQAPDAFRTGQYALVNLLSTPVPNVLMGAELQWARRENNSDGWRVDGYRLQVSFRYSFAQSM